MWTLCCIQVNWFGKKWFFYFFSDDFLWFLWRKDGWKSRWVLSDWKRAEGKAGTFKYTAGKWSADPDDKGTQVTFIILIKRKKWPLLCYVPEPVFLGMESYIIVAELASLFFFLVHFNLANINNSDDTNSSGSTHSDAMKSC